MALAVRWTSLRTVTLEYPCLDWDLAFLAPRRWWGLWVKVRVKFLRKDFLVGSRSTETPRVLADWLALWKPVMFVGAWLQLFPWNLTREELNLLVRAQTTQLGCFILPAGSKPNQVTHEITNALTASLLTLPLETY